MVTDDKPPLSQRITYYITDEFKKFFSAPTNEPIRDKKAERNLFARRTLVAFVGILALSGVLFANIYHLQVVNYDMYQTRSNGNRIKLLPLPPTRGLIYDRYGELLAENLTFFGLYIVPEKTENLDRTFEELRYVVGLTDEDIEHFKKSVVVVLAIRRFYSNQA